MIIYWYVLHESMYSTSKSKTNNFPLEHSTVSKVLAGEKRLRQI